MTNVVTTQDALLLQQDFSDFDDFADFIRGWDLQWLQLEKGNLQTELFQFLTVNAQLTKVNFNRRFEQGGAAPPGKLTFAFAEIGGIDEWCNYNIQTQHDYLLVFKQGGDYGAVSTPIFNVNTISFDEAHLEYIAETLELPSLQTLDSKKANIFRYPANFLNSLRATCNTIHRSLVDDRSPENLLRAEKTLAFDLPVQLLQVLDMHVEKPLPIPTSFRRDVVREAMQFIESSAHLAPSILEVCRASHVSWRTLDYAFKETLGIAPKQYLKAVRLRRVRQALRDRDAATTIAKVARQWGFRHMGQFSQDYRAFFGETPSATKVVR